MAVILITVIGSSDHDQITMGIETLRNIVIITTDIFAVKHLMFQVLFFSCFLAEFFAKILSIYLFIFLKKYKNKSKEF